MAYTTFKATKTNNYTIGTERKVAANNADFDSGTPVSIGATGAVPSTAGTTIIGVSVSATIFASDNFTVAKANVIYVPATAGQLYNIAITGGTITIADQGKYYNLTATAIVDGATESAVASYVNTSDAGAAIDSVIKYQVRLERFISSTLGEFSIVLI